MSLWPLAAVLLVGAGLLGLAMFGASRVSWLGADRTESQLLDSLAVDARLFTPAGSHEVRLSRLPACQQGDSAVPQVERELSFDRTFDKTAVVDEIISAYVRQGWSRNAFAPHNGTASRAGTRGVRVEANPAARSVYIDVSDSSLIC
jgi:hypothetical protein